MSRSTLQAAARAIASSEAQLNAVFDTVVDGIVTFDEDGLIQRVNPAARRIFGHPDGELIGAAFGTLIAGQDPDATLADAAGALGTEREVVGRRHDGSTFPMVLAVSDFELLGRRMYSAVVRDVTERKRVDRIKAEFISTVSHELRTPLTSIRGALGLVIGRFGQALPDKARQMLEMADRNSERLTLLINDILDLEKIESGRMSFEFKPLDLVSLLLQVLEANHGFAARHGVRLSCRVEVDRAMVWGDAHRLLQVFANLVSNAVKFTPADGVVELGLAATDKGFRATVRDHGPGIAHEFRSCIFQRFAQADSSDSRERGGTGLGLSITKAIVERHGGQVGYQTELGVGTEFHFDLAQWRSRIEHERSGADAATVLICEDSPDVAQILSGFLENEGHHGDIAATAADAKAMLATRTYRLMLLDLSLPDMDGLQLLRELREDPRTQALPIIVVSGRALESQPAAGVGVNVADWLQKPLDRQRFSDSVCSALRSAGRRRILHVEDDLDVVQIAHSVLEDLAELSHASTVREACQRIAEDAFDLVLLDLTLADGAGIEVLDALDGRCPVVIFSGEEPSPELSRKVTAALTKSRTSNDQLAAVIRQALCAS